MKIERVQGGEVLLRLSEDHLRIILGTLREIGAAIDEFEFYARIGALKTDVAKACVALKEEMEAASIEI